MLRHGSSKNDGCSSSAVVRESGALTRVVLEKEAKAAQARKKKRKAKNDKAAGWRNFCYDDFDKTVRNRRRIDTNCPLNHTCPYFECGVDYVATSGFGIWFP